MAPSRPKGLSEDAPDHPIRDRQMKLGVAKEVHLRANELDGLHPTDAGQPDATELRQA